MAEQSAAPAGRFSWNELMTGNTAACRDFYTGLMGWEYQEVPMGESTYTVFTLGGENVAGMMSLDPAWGPVPPHWMGYISVDDVDASTQKAAELGGEVKMPPQDIPGIGRFSMIADPSGAVVALITFLPME